MNWVKNKFEKIKNKPKKLVEHYEKAPNNFSKRARFYILLGTSIFALIMVIITILIFVLNLR